MNSHCHQSYFIHIFHEETLSYFLSTCSGVVIFANYSVILIFFPLGVTLSDYFITEAAYMFCVVNTSLCLAVTFIHVSVLPNVQPCHFRCLRYRNANTTQRVGAQCRTCVRRLVGCRSSDIRSCPPAFGGGRPYALIELN